MPEQLLKRLSDNEEVLTSVINLLQEAVKDKSRISPAGEWLLDNYYLIESKFLPVNDICQRAIVKDYPGLLIHASAGLPSVYDIALKLFRTVTGMWTLPA
jgi:hypothetical protein